MSADVADHDGGQIRPFPGNLDIIEIIASGLVAIEAAACQIDPTEARGTVGQQVLLHFLSHIERLDDSFEVLGIISQLFVKVGVFQGDSPLGAQQSQYFQAARGEGGCGQVVLQVQDRYQFVLVYQRCTQYGFGCVV